MDRIYRGFTGILLGGPLRIVYNFHYLEKQAQMSIIRTCRADTCPWDRGSDMVGRWSEFLRTGLCRDGGRFPTGDLTMAQGKSLKKGEVCVHHEQLAISHIPTHKNLSPQHSGLYIVSSSPEPSCPWPSGQAHISHILWYSSDGPHSRWERSMSLEHALSWVSEDRESIQVLPQKCYVTRAGHLIFISFSVKWRH